MEKIIKEILEKENIDCQEVTKATSGFTNLVYFLDDKFVLKMSKEEKVKAKLDKEASIYKNVKISCIPTFKAAGRCQDFQYLIISRLQGKSLYSIWHKLSGEEREGAVKQIAQILKEFNAQDSNFLESQYKIENWAEYMAGELKTKIEELKEMGYQPCQVQQFVDGGLSTLFKNNTYGLVYNDAHFDNFIYNDGILKLIDFDRVVQCPIDYEMLIFKTMCENPLKFASEEDEPNIKEEDYAGIYQQLKKEYPKMFEDENVEKRIAVYQFNYLMGQAIKCKDKEWIEKLLQMFKQKIWEEKEKDIL